MAQSLTVEGIGGAHSSDKYVIARIHFPARLIKGEINAEAVITTELHLVKNLKANLLIGTEILVPEQCDIFTTKKILRINTCGVDVPIIVKANSVYPRPVYVKDDTTIAPGTRRIIPIQKFCVENRDYLYEPIQLDHLHAFAHIINVKTVGELVQNDSNKATVVRKGTRVGYLESLTIEQGLSASAFMASDVAFRNPPLPELLK
ncbi:hypothetical protein K3495_g4004 [Podosphaera aphanis]|nr:hypothetical protein K3495_g4004 [Podosphaera aphanis]